MLTSPVSHQAVHLPVPAAERAVREAGAGAGGYAPHSGRAAARARPARSEGALAGRALDEGAAGAIAAARLLGVSGEAARRAARSHATALGAAGGRGVSVRRAF